MGKQKPKKNLPLEGIKVIDAASFIAGPVVSALMSDYGAEVVKIEPPNGDSYRNVYKGSDLWPENLDQWEFLLENRNKRSLAVDLKSSEGQIIVERLIMQSDVFITNLPFKPRLQLGLTASRVRELNSRIIYASLTGYGEKGSDSERNALDATAWWARSGMMDWSTSNLPNAQPPYPIPGAGDHPTGISLLSSILLALINRQKTDEGTTVSTSLLANGIWSNSVLIQSILAGNPPVESFHWDELSALRNIYFTKDNVLFFLMVLNEEKHWELLLDRLNIGELARDERFENAEARNSNKGLLMTILQDRLSELECAQIETVLQDTGIIFSRVSSAQQTISDPQTHANGMFMDYGDFEGEKKQLVAPPINVENAPRIKAKGAPEIGEHNIVVLEELGFSSDQIIDFKNKGVLG